MTSHMVKRKLRERTHGLEISKAFFLGVIILLVGDLSWLFVLKAELLSDAAAYFWWALTVFAGFISAYFSVNRKIILSLSLSIPSVILIGVSNYVYEVLGNMVDFPGLTGSLFLMGISLPWNALLCFVGGGVGFLLSRTKREKTE